MSQWLAVNRQWVFSGIGVFVLAGLFWFIRRFLTPAAPLKQSQRSGPHSTNLQAGRDINIGGVRPDDRRP